MSPAPAPSFPRQAPRAQLLLYPGGMLGMRHRSGWQAPSHATGASGCWTAPGCSGLWPSAGAGDHLESVAFHLTAFWGGALGGEEACRSIIPLCFLTRCRCTITSSPQGRRGMRRSSGQGGFVTLWTHTTRKCFLGTHQHCITLRGVGIPL